jgi:hypothetical protein
MLPATHVVSDSARKAKKLVVCKLSAAKFRLKERIMIRKLTIAVATGCFTFLPVALMAQIAPGTQLSGMIDQDLSSRSAQVGDRFTVSGVHSQNNDVIDAKIYGHVAQVSRAGQGSSGIIALSFENVRLPSGYVYSLEGSDTISAQIKTKSNAWKELAGVAVGALAGKMLGHAIGSAVAGTVIGAGAGYAITRNNRENVTIPQNSEIVIEVRRTLPREQAH